uniref:Uncharacterized protein n=1 Tax=viral metagenome TaxID=1070528 RepID=A0A6C0APM3_9ZZZZ
MPRYKARYTGDLSAYRKPYVTDYTDPLEELALMLYELDDKFALHGLKDLTKGSSYVRLNYGNVFNFGMTKPEYIGKFEGLDDKLPYFTNEYIPVDFYSLMKAFLNNEDYYRYKKWNDPEIEKYEAIKGIKVKDQSPYPDMWNEDIFIHVPSKEEIDAGSDTSDSNKSSVLNLFYLKHKLQKHIEDFEADKSVSKTKYDKFKSIIENLNTILEEEKLRPNSMSKNPKLNTDTLTSMYKMLVEKNKDLELQLREAGKITSHPFANFINTSYNVSRLPTKSPSVLKIQGGKRKSKTRKHRKTRKH